MCYYRCSCTVALVLCALVCLLLCLCVPEGNISHSLRLFTRLALSCYSLANNYICDDGNMEGLNALVVAIKQMPNLSSLKCASSRLPYSNSYLFRQV